MSVTRLYNESHPDGAVVNSADIDTVIKEHKVDVRERMVDLGAVDFASVLAAATLSFDFLRVKAAAGSIKDVNNVDVVSWSAQRFVKHPSSPKVSVYSSVVLSVTGGFVPTKIAFNAEHYDVGTLHDISTNNTRLTIPTGGDGYYLITGAAHFQLTAGANISTALFLYKNNTSLATSGYTASIFDSNSVSINNSYAINLNYVIPLVAGDYVELVYTANTTSQQISNATFQAALLP